jgi:hypothetical protein
MLRRLRKPPDFTELANELLAVFPQATDKEAIATLKAFLEAAWRGKKKLFKP